MLTKKFINFVRSKKPEVYSLEELDPSVSLVDLEDFAVSSERFASFHYEYEVPGDHDDRLEHVGPDDCFDAALVVRMVEVTQS